MTEEIILRRLVNELPKFSYRFADEKTLHDGIAKVLDGLGLSYQREYAATDKERFDFFLADGIVIEAKVDGTFPEAAQQIDRYLQLEVVRAVAIVTAKRWERRALKPKLRGKRFVIIDVKRQAF